LVFLFSVNILLSSTFILYENKWYIYLIFLALASIVNSSSVLLILGSKIIKGTTINYRKKPKNYMYLIPCYNESMSELKNSIDSLVDQSIVVGDKRCIVIVCDGRVVGQGNEMSTDNILLQILNCDTSTSDEFIYMTWDNSINKVSMHQGFYTFNNTTIPFILLIKHRNVGKRDSLVLVRKLIYCYNNKITIDDNISKYFLIEMNETLSTIYNNNTIPGMRQVVSQREGHERDNVLTQVSKQNENSNMNSSLLHNSTHNTIEYIIGVDADTIFDYYCSNELIKQIDSNPTIHGAVGFVDIVGTINNYSIFKLYQYSEYVFAQCLKRRAQSLFTKKVSCLSGCVQILRVSEETCGNKILEKLNYLPQEEESIFNHIRSYASEDRNHVCLFLSMYPNVKTTQTLSAIAYTSVPLSFNVFFSQRRRWSLGANSNDMMLVYLPGINIFERIAAFINVFTFCIQPFIFIATIFFLINIITNPTYLMLLLAIIILIPAIYTVMIPIFIKPMQFRNAMYFYFSYLVFISMNSIVNLSIYFNSIVNMDIIKWGKTRTVVNNGIVEPIYSHDIKKNKMKISYYDTSIDNMSIDNYIMCDDTMNEGKSIDSKSIDGKSIDGKNIYIV